MRSHVCEHEADEEVYHPDDGESVGAGALDQPREVLPVASARATQTASGGERRLPCEREDVGDLGGLFGAYAPYVREHRLGGTIHIRGRQWHVRINVEQCLKAVARAKPNTLAGEVSAQDRHDGAVDLLGVREVDEWLLDARRGLAH